MSATTATATTAKPEVEQDRPPARPRRSTRSDFNLEPNPFEQSFRTPHPSNVRQSSGQSDTPAGEDANGPSSADSKIAEKDIKKSDTPPPVLPPAATIASPADPHNFSQWGFSPSLTNSLRAGPLSPAMLAGPQMGGYDPNAFRTGFTPRTGLTPRTGMTPGLGSGLTPLIGGSVSFPPPSPNTAAFLALMTANQQNSHTTNTSNLHQADTITPNTFSAITGGAFNTSMNKNVDQYNGVANSLRQEPPKEEKSSGSNASQVSFAASTAADGLFLLSQAHQELLKRDQNARAAASEEVQSAPTAKVAPGRKRKAAPAAPTTKRTRTARGRNVEADDDEDDDDESMPDYNGDGKNETEEEKRKNFLERNRQAALKCRQRKKAWLSQLQSQNEYLKAENDRLQTALVAAREEISRIQGISVAPSGGKGGHGQPVSVAVSVGKGGNGRGYGY